MEHYDICVWGIQDFTLVTILCIASRDGGTQRNVEQVPSYFNAVKCKIKHKTSVKLGTCTRHKKLERRDNERSATSSCDAGSMGSYATQTEGY